MREGQRRPKSREGGGNWHYWEERREENRSRGGARVPEFAMV
jgi:hypothetical protein